MVLARRERSREQVLASHAALPSGEIEEVVVEDRLAMKPIEAVAAEAAAERDNHALCAAFGNGDVGGDRVIAVEDAQSVANGNAGVLADVSEFSLARCRARAGRQEPGEPGIVDREDVVVGGHSLE